MPDGIPFHDPTGLWVHGSWVTDVRTGSRRSNAECREQTTALRALTADMEHVVYAVKLDDENVIKIGASSNFVQRRKAYTNHTILAFRPGTRDDESRIHKSLAEHRARGREYYHPVPEVIAVVNDLRTYFNLPPLEAA